MADKPVVDRLSRNRAVQRHFSRLLFAVSLVLPILVGASLTVFHLPYQTANDGVLRLVRDLDPGRGWRALHVLSTSCGCSHRVAEHLLQRHRFASAEERILLVGQDSQLTGRLISAGYKVESVSGDMLAARYGLAGAPWLIIVSPAGKVAYQGGYASDARAANGFEDGRIWQQLQAGREIETLPVFGCAIARSLQRKMDPLALQYSRD